MVSKYFDLMVSVGKSENAGKDYGVLPYVFALFSSIIWPLSWIYCNEHSINTARTTMIRGCTCFIANYLICLFTKTNTTFPDGSIFKRIILRSLILSLTSLTMGVSQYILPLSIVHMIMSSSTLFVFVIDYLLNGVKVNLKQAIGISIGMVGVVLASNGKLISTMIDPQYQEHSNFQNYITDDIRIISLFTVFLICVTILTSYAFVITKSLKCNPFQLNFCLGLSNLFWGSIVVQFIPNQVSPVIEEYDWTIFYKAIVFTGFPLLFDQWFLIGALTMSKTTGIISMISFNATIVAYLVSVFRYDERPNMFINVGICLLLLGLYQTLFNIDKKTNKEEIESVSEEDNQDGTLKEGIHKHVHKIVDKEQETPENNQNAENKDETENKNDGKINTLDRFNI